MLWGSCLLSKMCLRNLNTVLLYMRFGKLAHPTELRIYQNCSASAGISAVNLLLYISKCLTNYVATQKHYQSVRVITTHPVS